MAGKNKVTPGYLHLVTVRDHGILTFHQVLKFIEFTLCKKANIVFFLLVKVHSDILLP
jgi:hypothetical protein